MKDAQQVLSDDLYTCEFGWGPANIEANNAGGWDGVVPVRGFGISNLNAIQSLIGMKASDAR